ncbi:hypothetical protein [Mucilaginibacter sp. L196]|uniref:hypothetical protein n=1 Tax=Mucilaginibacter sp. L196 TaxID=1641870 RepID=UPI00131DB12C|nr:hypothetical protein [Mucilaginibacter sp. L196]
MEIETLTVAERKCKDCGTPLGAGREGRLYCDSYCKTNYNNRRRRENQQGNESHEEISQRPEAEQLSIPDYITRIQEILLNNRRIMEGLCSEDRAGRIRMRDLIGKGFNTKFITSEAEPTESGRVYHFCFEYGYYEENGYVIVVCRRREVD